MRKSFLLLLTGFGLILFNISISYSQVSLQTLPFAEYFDSIAFPDGWTQQHEMGVTTDIWAVNNSNDAGGSPYELKANWVNEVGYTRLVLPPINTNNVPGMLLSFKHMMYDYYFGLVFKIQSSSDGVNWDDENWFRFSGWGSIGPEQAYTTILHNLGDTTYVAFEIEGDHYEFWAWHIDDVTLDVMSSPPGCAPLLFPTDGDPSVSINNKFKWTPTPGAADYLFYLGTDNPPSNMLNGAFANGMEQYDVYNLQIGTQYYWRVVPFNIFGEPEHCEVRSFTTMLPYGLPFEEHFDSITMPFAWMEQDSAVNPGWYIFQGSYVGDSANEIEIDFQAGQGKSRIITPPINSAGYQTLDLHFNYGYGDDGPGLILKVQSSNDAIHWTDEAFHFHSDSVQFVLSDAVETTIVHNLGGIVYIAFTVDGDLNAFMYWAIDDVIISPTIPETGSCSGLVTYDNTQQSALQNVTIYIKDTNSVIIDSTHTDVNGNFNFPALNPGNYHIEAKCSLPWGGGNALDGLLIMRHFVGIITLPGIRALAGDVDASHFINALDGLFVMKRFVGLVSSFSSGNWCLESADITIIPGQDTPVILKGLCFGDVDGSRTFAP